MPTLIPPFAAPAALLLALLSAAPSRAIAADPFRSLVDDQRAAVEQFFGRPYPKPFEVRETADRQAFDAELAARWAMPASQCWMVAAGDGGALVALSPARWSGQACEHDGSDPAQVRSIIRHELVHVFHGQHSPRPDFAGMDDLGWLVEGLAVYASGQLAAEHAGDAAAALRAGALPADLESAWSGRYRYGVAGSLVAYIDRRWGRDTLDRLLAVTTEADALALLGVTEDALLAQWRADLADATGAGH